ncbi:hypothetical protein [Oceanivirga miroungae]|uniref:Uncharacterized protein n=1 Tax=Oceanivirga miroungae TaxID=1130046 RepID=A0A6I8MCC6_9FUSO|nr:hypothetical protein [Oceanivirga miroungae]VWL84759.1 hypothetical protein OMES3154_00007 [Oceanivirga miroungae]
MKKLLVAISILFSLIIFSETLYDGNYRATLNENNKIYVMDIIVKNNNIFSTSFDIKSKNGRSLIFGNIEIMEEKTSIERRLKNTVNIEYIYINNDTDTENIKKIYYFLIDKIEKGEQGRYILK